MSKKKLAGIIVGCIIAIIIIVAIATPTHRPTYTLSISVNPPQAGSVSPSGGEYESGVQVTLTASPASGYAFDNWSGSGSGAASIITITMNSDKSLTANFKATTQTYTLTTNISTSGAGSVSPSGGEYESGVEVTLTATPASGYTFEYWDGAASGSSNVVTITMDSDKIVTAHFKSEPTPESENLTVHFIDVGQGDSILLDLGDTEVLIDGGDKSPGVVSYINDYVDGTIEVMVATHPHADHIGGLIGVLGAFKVDEIWLNGDTSTSGTYSQFMSAVDSEGAEVHIARRGDTIHAGNLTFSVLSPVNLGSDTNDNSIVLSLSYGQVDFLFTGDAQKEAEASMLAADIVPDVDILKVGHHGSRTASSIQFLQAAKPECAIYMAGIGNSYGHPHPETISNLCEIGAKIYGTDIHGTITITTDGVTYTVLPSNNVPPVACQETVIPSPPIDELSLEIVSVTSHVSPGAYATLQAKASPGAQCTIAVYYKSGRSTAQGLYAKQADNNGDVSWTWKVGTSTTPGSWRIVVTAAYEGETISRETYFGVE